MVSDVLIENARANLQNELRRAIESPHVADAAFAWLGPNLPVTLKLDTEATLAAQDSRAAEVEDVMKRYPAGTVLVEARKEESLHPIDEASLDLLHLEHEALLRQRTFSQQVGRSLAVGGMWIALYTLVGFYLFYRERRLIDDLRHFAMLLTLVLLTVTLAVIISKQAPQADVIPLLICGMTLAIAYYQELALLLSAAVALVVVVAVGHDLAGAIVLTATTTGAIIVLRQVRSRSKLLSVGFIAAMVAFLTTIGVGTLQGQPFQLLLEDGFILMLWSIIAGSLMTVLLPTVEKTFQVQTDLSLIELGDPAHPLLQELIRRAPGTYNHSITVASLAEAAAEAIGARGLLVRVGAYFHDIGKMLKPGYFVENQGLGDNRHESLVPAMSTLVIIAHVKDGADLARQNRLPQQIIDFIQQHHGTTLVEYFYRQASEQQESDPDAGDVDESTFRYPGPKPQSKEAGVLMLADAVESASRVLVEPTPARIESLVEELSMKRLMDGQFDECGLTLEEVRKIGESLVKSLTAVYHGRVKYPDQETA